MAGEGGCGGFSIRAGDADGGALQKPAGELQFADDRNAASAHRLQQREIGRNTGREDHQVAIFKRRRGLRLHRNAGGVGIRMLVDGAHLRSFFVQQTSGGDARTGHSYHHHKFSGQFQTSYLSFKVVSANSAMIRPRIQKRVMIFDSGQPSASK